MKITPVLIVLAVCVALASILPRACQPDPLPHIAEVQAALDSSRLVYAADTARLHGEARAAQARADSSAREAHRQAAVATRYRGEADRLRAERQALPDSAPCDTALRLAVAETDTLRSALDTMTAAAGRSFQAMRDAQLVAAAAFTGQVRAEGQTSYERQQLGKQRDEAIRAYQRARNAQCPKLLGLPLPQVGVGYGAMWTGGHLATGPEVSASIPLACLVR